MPSNRLDQLRADHDGEISLEEPPDLGPLRDLAEREELADAVSRLADSYGHPLPASDALAPLARGLARAMTEVGFTLHHCVQDHPL
jgi:hypothetical protein